MFGVIAPFGEGNYPEHYIITSRPKFCTELRLFFLNALFSIFTEKAYAKKLEYPAHLDGAIIRPKIVSGF